MQADVVLQEVANVLGRSVNVVNSGVVMVRNTKGHFTGKHVEFVLSGAGVNSPQKRNYVRGKVAAVLEGSNLGASFERTSKTADVTKLIIKAA